MAAGACTPSAALPECHGQCTHAGMLSDSAGTALALLPFLAAG